MLLLLKVPITDNRPNKIVTYNIFRILCVRMDGKFMISDQIVTVHVEDTTKLYTDASDIKFRVETESEDWYADSALILNEYTPISNRAKEIIEGIEN